MMNGDHSMSALLGVIAAFYGASMLVVAGGGLIWALSPRFHRTPEEKLETR
jgi:hypothetical protein